MKRGHIMGLILGDGERMLEILQAVLPAPPKRFLHGMLAFALEQQGSYQEAEAVAREGLGLKLGEDAWLDHALAHALYFQGPAMNEL